MTTDANDHPSAACAVGCSVVYRAHCRSIGDPLKMAATNETPTEAFIPGYDLNQRLSAMLQLLTANQNYLTGLYRYTNDFLLSFLISNVYFWKIESEKLASSPSAETLGAYLELLKFNGDLVSRGGTGVMEGVKHYAQSEMGSYAAAILSACASMDTEDLVQFAERQNRLMDIIANAYPSAIKAIEPEFGFHFERGDNPLVAETDRFYLYQIAPTRKGVSTRPDGKPIIILPPYVLGANILAFLPGEGRSYTHCFANQGVPTYIRILKSIDTSEALQTMTGEDDAADTRYFCETVMQRHGRPVTLNGYCQGGFSALCNLLAGELDGLVDALITCVSPIDGTRSKGLSGFLADLPDRFNDLAYGTKTLPNGNTVADGRLMGWVYKLKSIEMESPLAAFYRDLLMFARQGGDKPVISKTAAALNYWLNNERFDLPLEITRMSFASYRTPITADGTLPVKLFGKKLNFSRLKEKKIPWLLCYGEHDDLVEAPTALAPQDYLDVETAPFPKGHVAIATSWSAPDSACALHTRFGDGDYRGPVRFHLDLEAAAAKGTTKAPTVGRKAAAKSTGKKRPGAASAKPRADRKKAGTSAKRPGSGRIKHSEK